MNIVSLQSLLDEAQKAFASEQPELALSFADKALQVEPYAAGALFCRAAALSCMKLSSPALSAYRLALKHHPESLPIVLGAIELLLEWEQNEEEDQNYTLEALHLIRQALDNPQAVSFARVELLELGGYACRILGDYSQAWLFLEEAAALDPENGELVQEKGAILFQLCRFEESEVLLQKALDLCSDAGWAHYYLAQIAERKGHAAQSAFHHKQAYSHDPETFRSTVDLSKQDFAATVREVLIRLPVRVQDYLTRVTMDIESFPSDKELHSFSPPLSPEILALFHETSTDKHSVSGLPDSLLLFQNNLQRTSSNHAELLEEIELTILHEVSRFIPNLH